MPTEIRNADRLPAEIRFFYAWQDDHPSGINRNFIRASIRNAITRVQREIQEETATTLVLDAGVEGRSGAEEITQIIMEKIRDCNAVIADVTISARSEDGSGFPNPNVMAELGYAAGRHTWRRIVPVCNEAFGRVEQLPFDIRGRPTIRYTLNESDDRSVARRGLDDSLYFAIRSIVEQIDHGPPSHEETGDTTRTRRDRDIRLLREIMSTIHSGTLEFFVEQARLNRILQIITYYWEGFRAAVDAVTFNFHDGELQQRIQRVRDEWGACLDCYPLFGPEGDPIFFSMKSYEYFGQHEREMLEYFQAHVDELDAAVRNLFSYVHAQYPEIDVEATDAAAADQVRPYTSGEALQAVLDQTGEGDAVSSD